MHGDKSIESSSDKIMGKHIEELHLGINDSCHRKAVNVWYTFYLLWHTFVLIFKSDVLLFFYFKIDYKPIHELSPCLLSLSHEKEQMCSVRVIDVAGLCKLLQQTV